MRSRHLTALSLALLLSSQLAGRASAEEIPNVGGKPLLVDVTNTAVTAYHFNNRNDSDLNPPTQVDDGYGEFLDRLNIQASWWRLRAGFRLDTSTYFNTPDRDKVASLVKEQTPAIDAAAKAANRPEAAVANDVTNNFYTELHSRFLRSIYPSKLFVGYSQPGLDVTVGDFYVQLGRGLVFSVRKIDELAVDTTVRGAKAVADTKLGDVKIAGTLFGGQMNPLRVDEASGRRLNGSGSPLFFAFPTGGNLETYDITSDPGAVHSVIQKARPSYFEDSVAGGRVDVTTRWFGLGGNVAGLFREANTGFSSTDPSKRHNKIVNWSGTLNVPSILKHADLYVEVAGQAMRDGQASGGGKAAQDLDGYAVYASASVNAGPVSLSLEGKHYRNFFPLSANIDSTTPGFGAPEFSLVTYSQAPTAEPVYTEIVSGGAPGVCVTGGRGRIDYRYNRETSLYAWLGGYTSWSEIPATDLASGCVIAPSANINGTEVPLQTYIWDAATGVDLGFANGQTHVKAWVGARTSDTAVPELTQAQITPITAFYREGYVRYDMIFHLAGPFSLQLQGFHRHRWEPVSFVKPWTEGENYTALQWSPHFAAIFGYEYLAKEKCQPPRSATISDPARPEQDFCNYVSGGLQWRAAGAWSDQARLKYVTRLFDTISLFVGQRRGAIRCVSGVCRQFPPFEGARLEITSRF